MTEDAGFTEPATGTLFPETPDYPCSLRCGYYSQGEDLADHERREHVPCPECGAGEDQDLSTYALCHKASCPRLAGGAVS